MKLNVLLFSAVLLLANASRLNAQTPTAQHDSLRVHIIENENGNMMVIDTVVAASQQEQLHVWLTSKGVNLPPLPDGHDSLRVELVQIINDGDSLPNNMRIIGPPLPPDAPLPPPTPDGNMEVIMVSPPPAPGEKKCQMVIICDTAVHHQDMKVRTNNPNGAKQQVIINKAPDGKTLTVFPNPTSGLITVNIDMPGKEKAELTITDMNGKVVYSEQLGTATEKLTREIDLGKFGKGMYNVEVSKGENRVIRRISVE